MFSLPDFSVKRPVCVFICLVSLILFGVSSVFEMPLESTPEMNMPTMTIMTSYPDASPDEVDEMVTQKIESALSGITEVESMTSTSSEGSSMIMLEFGYDVDTDDKYQDITSALAMVQLPEDCSDPTVMQMDSSSMNSSILNISISTTDADNAVAYVEDNIVPEIERIEGVADVEVSGGTRQYIRVLLDEDTMTQYGLSMQQIASAISSAEYETTLGELNRGSISLTLIGSAEYDSWRDLEDIPISLPSGAVIYLSDVADVEMVEQERTSYSRQNGEENISISVAKEQDGNTVSICNQIEELVNEFNAGSSLGLTLEIISNSGEDIYDNIMSVVTSLIEGLVIAALVLVFFFGEWKSSFIVVIDSCSKSTEDGLDYVDAVHVGANLVFSSIVASTATTVVVFLPIAMMDGMSGQLFRDVCYTIVFSLLASMLGALTLVPLLFVKMRPREKLTSRSHVMMHALEGKYEALLRRALRARKTVVASAIACLAIAGFLFTQIDMELMPAGSTNTISVSVETRSGLDLENTNAIMEEIESMISEDPDVESYSLRVSGGGSSMDMMNSEFGSIGKALLIAVYLVFAVMAIQFESVIFSLVVLFSIPFSLTGAFLALYITGSSISMTSLIGLVMLAGIVVNNAIVLVDYAGTLRREGMEVHEALVTAGKRRLRPILMSSLTTIVGLIPMAAGFGGEVEMMQGMAVVVIGGLSLSTVLTLVLIPTFYLIFDREDRNNRRMQRKIAREVSSAQMSWAAGTEPPVDLNPAEEQTLLHVGREYRFYFADAQGEIPDPEFWEGCTLEAELDEEEEREYTETFEVRADEAGRLYLAVELSPENSGLRTIRYKTAFENTDGERWFAWNELKALFEPVDVQEEEIWIWYEEDCWPRDYDDDTVQYLNFTRQEVIFDPELEQVTLHFGNDAVYTVALGEERRFRLGCVTEPDQELRAALGDQTGEAEVVDFTGDPRFEAVGTLTLRSEKQYLYLWEDGVFTLLDSVWDGSTHTLKTAELGCYVLTDTPL